jgi:hypothetical protein
MLEVSIWYVLFNEGVIVLGGEYYCRALGRELNLRNGFEMKCRLVGYALFFMRSLSSKSLQKQRETVAKTIFDDCDELKKSFKFGPFLGPHLSCMPDHTAA